jgi:hypothetical protein
VYRLVAQLLAATVVSLVVIATAAATPDAGDAAKPQGAGIASNPYGWLDGVDGNGVASGWTCDPDDFSQPLHVHFYVDGPAGTGSYIGQTYADLTREPAVGDACGGWRNHGYGWRLPGWLWDGQWHRLYAHAISIGPGGNELLQGSGLWFRLGGTSPIGWVEALDGDGVAHGWTCDPDDPSQPLHVHFYVDGSFVGQVYANLTREPAVGDACGGWRNHGYNFILPESVRDSQARTLSVWAINVGPGDHRQLNGSPRGFVLDPSLEIESFQWGDWGIEAVPSSAVGAGPAAEAEAGASAEPEAEGSQQVEARPADEAETGASREAEAEGSEEVEPDPADEAETGASAEAEATGSQQLEAGEAREGEAGAAAETEAEGSLGLEAGAAEEADSGAPAGAEAEGPPEAEADPAVETEPGASSEVPAEPSPEAESGTSESPAPGESPGVSSTRCEWHNFDANWKQTRLYTVLRYRGYFRICYIPNDRIVSVTNMWGDASWVCGWCGWNWLGNASGYPTHQNFGSHAVLRYRGTVQFCPPHFWCIGTRQPWVNITFYPNGTKRQVIGVV